MIPRTYTATLRPVALALDHLRDILIAASNEATPAEEDALERLLRQTEEMSVPDAMDIEQTDATLRRRSRADWENDTRRDAALVGVK